MPDLVDAPELLDVDVDQLPGPLAFVATTGSGGSSRESLPSPILVKIPETVDARHTQRKRDVLPS